MYDHQPERASVRFLGMYVTRQNSKPDASAFRLMGSVQSMSWDTPHCTTGERQERKQPILGLIYGERGRCGIRVGDGEFVKVCARIRGSIQFWAKSHSFTEDKIVV